ncbi:MAG: 1-deoxy-D-xylulose-5-phosphate reductoisomerase, partial [Microcystaceae cyanobacterium]
CDRFTTQNTSTPSLEDILAADQWARDMVLQASRVIQTGPSLVSV